jgi:hypothetical protein
MRICEWGLIKGGVGVVGLSKDFSGCRLLAVAAAVFVCVQHLLNYFFMSR